MRCKVLRSDAFDQVASDWDLLAQRYHRAPFMASDFVRTALRYLGAGNERIVEVCDEQGVVALGLFVRRQGLWETFQPSQSPIGALVVRDRASLPSVLKAAERALPLATLGVCATQQDPLFCERPTDEDRIRTLDYIRTAWVDISGTFDEYWNARGKNLRQNLRKQRRKLADEGIPPSLELVTKASDVPQAVADYAALESVSWKSAGGTAIEVDNDQGRFYAEMLRTFCSRGAGKICRYRFGDRIVAVDLCIESADSLVILKGTYDESAHGYSPTSLLREELLQHLWRQGQVKHVEFYGKVTDWHTRWAEQSRTLYHVNRYRWPVLMRAASSLAQRVRGSRTSAAPVAESA